MDGPCVGGDGTVFAQAFPTATHRRDNFRLFLLGSHFFRSGSRVPREPIALLDEHTAVRGPGTGWDLHEYRRSALSHLGEQGAPC